MKFKEASITSASIRDAILLAVMVKNAWIQKAVGITNRTTMALIP